MWLWPNLRSCSGICMTGLRKSTENLLEETVSLLRSKHSTSLTEVGTVMAWANVTELSTFHIYRQHHKQKARHKKHVHNIKHSSHWKLQLLTKN
jgi:hypothetical protein